MSIPRNLKIEIMDLSDSLIAKDYLASYSFTGFNSGDGYFNGHVHCSFRNVDIVVMCKTLKELISYRDQLPQLVNN